MNFSLTWIAGIPHDPADRAAKDAATDWGCVAVAHKSLDQTHHPASFHSIEGVHDVIIIEDGQETLHGALPRLNVFPKDTPGVLYGPQKRVLVGVPMTQYYSTEPRFKPTPVESFRIMPAPKKAAQLGGGPGPPSRGGMPGMPWHRPKPPA